MPGARAESRPLYEAFNFGVSIDNGEDALFMKAGPLAFTISLTQYREGGAILPIKDPDQVEFPNIVLERGVSNSRMLYSWATNIAQSAMGFLEGNPIALDTRNMTIYQYTRDKKPGKKIHVYGCLPVEFVGGDWDNNTDSVTIERITLAYDYFEIA